MKWHVDIESAFGAFVQSAGGKSIVDIVGKSPSFPNADYIFPAEGVIAELKLLTEDKMEDEAMRSKFTSLFQSWISRNLVRPQNVPAFIKSADYPTLCQKEMYDVLAKPVKKHMAKANRQIRETKRHLGLPSAKGLLLLANDGNFALPPPVLLQILFKSLNSDFHSIDAFVLFTVNLFSTGLGINRPTLLWFLGTRDENAFPEAFSNKLYSGWTRFLEQRTGVAIDRLSEPELNTVHSLKFA